MKKHQQVSEKLKEKFKEIEKLNVTVDLWSSPNSKAIMGVTAHWVDKEWNLQDLLLDAVEVKGRHDGENLSSHLSTSMEHYDSVEKVFCITADNASNNGTMARERRRVFHC